VNYGVKAGGFILKAQEQDVEDDTEEDGYDRDAGWRLVASVE
jgi:hypothetical protein